MPFACRRFPDSATERHAFFRNISYLDEGHFNLTTTHSDGLSASVKSNKRKLVSSCRHQDTTFAHFDKKETLQMLASIKPSLLRHNSLRFRQNKQMKYFSTKDENSDESAEKKGARAQPLSLSVQKLLSPGLASQLIRSSPPDTDQDIRNERAKMGKRRSSGRIHRSIALSQDKDLYKKVRHTQALQKEQSRIRTATNIWRALCGNFIICTCKFGAWLSSGSSALLAEFIHSVVDCGNQSLLLVGLRRSRLSADVRHPYGYGKSVYFWALVSALGTFFLGAGVSMTNAVGELFNPSLSEITWHVWGVLGLSFTVDGYVFRKTLSEITATKPKDVSLYNHLKNLRDPATLAILLEDGAACLGIVLAIGGITASHVTGNAVFDGLAGVGISALLGVMGLALVRMNHRFLLGQGVDKEITDDIEKILRSRRSIDDVRGVQSQWTGPETFSYKAEVDFDGTYLAAKLMPIYQDEFKQIKNSMDTELQVLLSLYAEDVIRTVEREVRHSEAVIRKKYPGAEFIELEPMSKDVDQLAIDDNLEAELRRIEFDSLNKLLKSLSTEAASDEKQQQTGTLDADNSNGKPQK